jgi:hypothetical protein
VVIAPPQVAIQVSALHRSSGTAEPAQWIIGASIYSGLKMQVRAGGPSGGSDPAYRLTFIDLPANLDSNRGQMSVKSGEAIAVGDQNGISVRTAAGDVCDGSFCRRQYGRA